MSVCHTRLDLDGNLLECCSSLHRIQLWCHISVTKIFTSNGRLTNVRHTNIVSASHTPDCDLSQKPTLEGVHQFSLVSKYFQTVYDELSVFICSYHLCVQMILFCCWQLHLWLKQWQTTERYTEKDLTTSASFWSHWWIFVHLAVLCVTCLNKLIILFNQVTRTLEEFDVEERPMFELGETCRNIVVKHQKVASLNTDAKVCEVCLCECLCVCVCVCVHVCVCVYVYMHIQMFLCFMFLHQHHYLNHHTHHHHHHHNHHHNHHHHHPCHCHHHVQVCESVTQNNHWVRLSETWI